MSQAQVEVVQDSRKRLAATRTPPPAVSPGSGARLPPEAGPQLFTYDPALRRLTSATQDDPIFTAIQGAWRDRQQHGRLAYEAMAKHPEVSSAFNAWLDFITAHPPTARPKAPRPTAKQKEIADFANHILDRIDWPLFVDGCVGQGLQFGFSLTEITTEVARWRGRDYITLANLWHMPQASLDSGYVPREEYGELSLRSDPRYRCFVTDERGRIERVYQFFKGTNSSTSQVEWAGPDLERILHYRHKGGDGNPFGESIFYSAFYAWSDLYFLERIERTFLDMGLPILLISYKTVDGIPRPATHAEIKDILEKQEISGTRRVLVLPDASGTSVAPSNPNFTEHISKVKEELRLAIRKAMGLPQPLIAENFLKEADSRNIVQVFFKYTLKARLAEVGRHLDLLLARFVRANYSGLDLEDYPKTTWSIVTENEQRVFQEVFKTMMERLDSAKLGEVIHRVWGFIEADDFPLAHEDSVNVQRPLRDTNDEPNSALPPTKQPGAQRRRTDGQTEGPAARNTAA